jgi:hypothetical protein
MKLKLNLNKRKTRKQRGGDDIVEIDDANMDSTEYDRFNEVVCFLMSERGSELALLLSKFNMSDKDWGKLKRNFISLSEKMIEDIPFKPEMIALSEKINASTDYIENASDELPIKPETTDGDEDCIDNLNSYIGFADDEIEEMSKNRDEIEKKETEELEEKKEDSGDSENKEEENKEEGKEEENKEEENKEEENKEEEKEEENKEEEKNPDSSQGGSKKNSTKSLLKNGGKKNKRVTFKRRSAKK